MKKPTIRNKNLSLQTREFQSHITKVHSFESNDDSLQGIIDAYVCLCGVEIPIWWFKEVVHNGAFKKTIEERGPEGTNQIRVLWQHRWGEVIGKPLILEEHSRDQLPADLLKRFPEATGGLFASTQFISGIQRAEETVRLYEANAMNEWSIGFDVINAEEEIKDEEEFFHIKELRLWEYSSVTWGANPATTTVDVRNRIDNNSHQHQGPEIVTPPEKKADNNRQTLLLEVMQKENELTKRSNRHAR